MNDALAVLKSLSTDIPPETGMALAMFACRPEDADADYLERLKADKYARKAWTAYALQPNRIDGMNIAGFAGRNCYVCISAFGPYQGHDGALMPVTHGRKLARRKENWAALTCVMLDDIGDEGGAVDAYGRPKTRYPTPMDLPIEPSWMVETSPGCYQAWYLFDQPLTDFDIASRFVDDLIAFGVVAQGDDPTRDRGGGMAGLTRYGRLPVGINNKRGLNWQVRILDDTYERYSIEAIAQAFGMPDPRRPIVPKQNASQYAPPESLLDIPPRFLILPDFLKTFDLYQSKQPKATGWLDITCPWSHQHGHAADTGAAYKPPSLEPGHSAVGAFHCHHSACQGRRVTDLADLCDRILYPIEQDQSEQS